MCGVYKRIDIDEDAEYSGFSYMNGDGYEEYVEFSHDDNVLWLGNDVDGFPVYVDDVPNLIKALQAVYDYKKGI